jgi:two-component sensor histidine kinase
MYVEQTFRPDPGEIGAARRLVRHALDGSPQVADVTLIVSELATNAVRHAGTAFTVSLTVNSLVRLEVADGSEVMPTQAVGGISNHGLDLVGLLADRWGIEPTVDGKSIWVEIDLT